MRTAHAANPQVRRACLARAAIRAAHTRARAARRPRRAARNRPDPASPLAWAAYNRAAAHPCQNESRCKSLFFKSPPSLVLASTSIYRRQLLKRLNLPFECLAPQVDETRQAGEPALALAVRLARAKAIGVAGQRPDAWVIGSDQVAVLPDGIVLGKPGTRTRNIEQLEACSGQVVSFLTAVALLRFSDASPLEFVDTTRVAFRVLERQEIERYVD